MSNQETQVVIVTSRPSSTSSQAYTGIQFDIESLVIAYYPYVRRLTYSILDNTYEADDAAQDTFIAASRALDLYRGEAEPKTWLTAIAINTCRGRLRRQKARRALQTVLEAIHLLSARDPNPEQFALQSEANQLVWQAVNTLDEKHRLVVILRYVHELPVADIANALGISQGTVHSRLHYARQKLLAFLGSSDLPLEVSDGAP